MNILKNLRSITKFLSISILATSALSSQASASEWAGSYIGLSAGFEQSDSRFEDTRTADTDNDTKEVGITVGYRHQFNNFVVGIAGDYFPGDSNVKQASFVGAGANTDMFEELSEEKSLSIQLGYAFEKFLPYITAGRMQIKHDFHTRLTSGGGVLEQHTKNRETSIVGAGLSYLIKENRILSFEYRQADFGNNSNVMTTFGSNNVNSDLNIEKTTITYSWKF